MAADHLQFLKDRFIREFHESEEEFGGEFPLHPQFHDIEKFLQKRTIKPSTPIQMKNELYDLIHELKECNMLAEKERDRKIQKKKSRFNVYTVKKLWFIYKTRKKLLRIKRKLGKSKDYYSAAAESSLPSDSVKVWNSSWVRPQAACEIHGVDDELKKIKALLLQQDDDGVKTIGIVGMSGVGKTTLARMLVNDQDCCRVFEPIIWVTLSKNLNPSQIMRQLFENLSYYDGGSKFISDASLSEQFRKLQNRLSSKKYLIVLDNVHSDLSSSLQTFWISHLYHCLPKGRGGAIIITSAIEEVATSMVGEENLFRLHPLFNAEALWSMFMDSIRRKEFLTSDHHHRLSRMKEEIIDRCDGLPLATKTLAEIISIQIGKEEYWSIADVPKKFCLRLDRLDDTSYFEAIKTARTLSRVDDVSASFSAGEITITGRCLPLEIARELGKSWPTELISVQDISKERYMVFKLGLHNVKEEKKAMKRLSDISRIQSVPVDMNEKLLVVGNVNAENVVSYLRKYWHAVIISTGPVKSEYIDVYKLDPFKLQSKDGVVSQGVEDIVLNDIEGLTEVQR